MSSDTALDVEAELDRLFAQRSGSERLRMACGMFDSARTIAIGAIRAARSDISDAERRLELFDCPLGRRARLRATPHDSRAPRARR